MYGPEYDLDAEAYRSLQEEYFEGLDEAGRVPADRTALPHPNTELGIHCIRLLHAVYNAKCAAPRYTNDPFSDGGVKLSSCLEELGLGDASVRDLPRWWDEAVVLLQGAKFVWLSGGSRWDFWGAEAGPELVITPDGERDVIRRNVRRSNTLYRAAVCRRNILRWLYDFRHDPVYRPELQVIFSSPWGTVEGDPFGMREIVSACEDLRGNSLVDRRAMVLTAAGIAYIDNGATLASGATAKGRELSITNNFHGGIGNFQLAQGNQSVQQSQLSNGVSAAEIVTLARALKEASESPAMEHVDSAELRRVATELEQVAQADEVDQARVRGLLDWARNIVNEGAGSALAAVLVSVLGNLAG